MPSTPRLARATLVVMGGTTGLGFSAALAFVAEGARVVVAGRDPDRLKLALEALGPNALGLAGDAREPETSAKAVQLAVEQFGSLTGLYHVAGGSGRRMGDGPLHELTPEGWRQTLDLNLSSVAFSNQAAIRQFLAQGTGGAILNMASVLGYSPSPGFFSTHAYAAAKAGIIGLTKAAASHYARDNIRVNAIAPALVNTPMATRAMGNDAIQQFIHVKQPLDGGRAGRPDDCDSAAILLLSDEGRFITGQTLAVDGGWTVSDGTQRR